MEKINFEDLPSTETPINSSNLNKMQQNIETEFKGGDWIDLPLAEGIEQYSTAAQYACKYRKIGNHVWIKGCVKGIVAENTQIAQLPAGFRPTNQYRFVNGHNTAYTDIFAMSTSGALTFVGTVNNAGTLAATDFHYIQTDFLVD